MPLLKLIFWLLLSFSTIFISNPFLLLALAGLLALLVLFSPYKSKLLPRLYPLSLTTSFIVLFQLVFNQQAAVAERLILGFSAGLRVFCLSLIVFYYTAVTSLQQIINSFDFLPSQTKLLLTITFSLIPAIFREAKIISITQTSRGFKIKKLNIFPLIIPLLHRTFKRAEQLSLVLSTKGY